MRKLFYTVKSRIIRALRKLGLMKPPKKATPPELVALINLQQELAMKSLSDTIAKDLYCDWVVDREPFVHVHHKPRSVGHTCQIGYACDGRCRCYCKGDSNGNS